jgi:DnaJ-class molecular chaperone
MTETMQNRNCYIVLGLNNTASLREIKSAYRLLAKKFHPDKNIGNKTSEEHFKEVQQAYSILSNPAKRKKYDLKFSYDGSNTQQKQYTPYTGNAYQYAQQQAKQQTQQNKQFDSPTTKPQNQYRTEINQIIISIIIALILLYFIVSYKF